MRMRAPAEAAKTNFLTAVSEFCFFNGESETVVKFFKVYSDSEVSFLIFFSVFFALLFPNNVSHFFKFIFFSVKILLVGDISAFHV